MRVKDAGFQSIRSSTNRVLAAAHLPRPPLRETDALGFAECWRLTRQKQAGAAALRKPAAICLARNLRPRTPELSRSKVCLKRENP